MPSWILPIGVRLAIVSAVIVLAGLGWGAFAWAVIGAWPYFCAYGLIFAWIMAYLGMRWLIEYSADDLQRRRLDLIANARWLERKARAEAMEAGVIAMPRTYEVTIHNGPSDYRTDLARLIGGKKPYEKAAAWLDHIRRGGKITTADGDAILGRKPYERVRAWMISAGLVEQFGDTYRLARAGEALKSPPLTR